MHLPFFSNHPDEIPRFWLGGLNAYGAVVGAVIFAALAPFFTRESRLKALDRMSLLLAPVGVMVWLGLWGEGIAYGQILSPATFGGIHAPDETGQMAMRFPLQFLAAAIDLSRKGGAASQAGVPLYALRILFLIAYCGIYLVQSGSRPVVGWGAQRSYVRFITHSVVRVDGGGHPHALGKKY